jgi:SsrA-binding protein
MSTFNHQRTYFIFILPAKSPVIFYTFAFQYNLLMGTKSATKEIINRKAKFEYTFIQMFEAGLVLSGTEVKALRQGLANLNDAYCLFDQGNLTVKNMFIAEYDHGTIYNHDSRRDRRLLLHKSELKKIERRVTEKGLTVVPYRLFFTDRGFAKLDIALAQGKKAFDKRETIKERDNKRDLDRLKKIKL